MSPAIPGRRDKERHLNYIEMTQDGYLGIITLNNPKKHNALSHALVDEVIAALQ